MPVESTFAAVMRCGSPDFYRWLLKHHRK